LEVREVLASYNVTVEKGLTTQQVEEATAKYGLNELRQADKTPLWKLVLEQFEDPLVITLLGAMLISLGTNLHDYYYPHGDDAPGFWEGFVEPSVILFILIFNALVGVWQEANAENALEALKRLQADKAVVIRNGTQSDVDAVNLVPGDILQLRIGDRVPADCRLVQLETATLKVEQASLTGESESVMKDTHRVSEDVDITGKVNILFMSTGIVGGRGKAVVIGTGMNTALGAIQKDVEEADNNEDTPLQKKIGEFGNQLQKVIFIICIVVWVINFRQFFDETGAFSVKKCLYYLKIAVALAVAAIPEGLPAVITTCLALGTRKMAQKNAIVRKLPSVETLGCTTVICSDKTGTLTTNEMSVVKLMYARKGVLVQHNVTGHTYAPDGVVEGLEPVANLPGVANLAQAASLCNDAVIKFEKDKFTRIGEPTEAALKVVVEKIGIPGQPRPAGKVAQATAASDYWSSQYKRVALLEFSRDRKSMSVLCQPTTLGTRVATLFVKGAPESVLQRCTRMQEAEGVVVDMSPAVRDSILRENEGLAKQALRTLAIAVKTSDLGALSTYDGSEDHPARAQLMNSDRFESIESGLTFLGIVGIKDPARPEVSPAIANCVQAGIRVIVITGDNKSTAESICRNIGIFEDDEDLTGKSFTGREFLALPEDEQLAHLFSDSRGRVFSRAEPAHKQRLIRLLKSRNEVVAMTGDGVNDAPALKAADIGIAMGISGTEVAKEASDMVLADDNFATIVSAVEEGRAIYNNTKAFIRYLISSNIGEVASIFLTAALGLPEIMVPVQLLWVNLVTDGPPATALGFNPSDADIMKKPPRRSDDMLISPWVFFRYLVVGTYVGVATVGVFVYWYTLYGTALDGHALVTFDQLRHWNKCDAAAIATPGNLFYKFFIPADKTGGVDLGGNPCDYFVEGKIKAVSMALSVLVVIEMFNALNALSEDGSLLQMPPWKNPWLLLAITLSMGVHMVIMYVPSLATLFQITALDYEDWVIIVAFSIPVVVIDEVLKFIGRLKQNAELASRLAHSKDN